MTESFISCNGPGSSPVGMTFGFLRSYFKSPEWFQFEDRDVIYTFQARYAIYLLCRLLHIGPGDEVLVPSYNCGAEIDPFISAGARAVLYKIDNHAKIDLNDLIQRVTPATKVIHVTHFFGWPQDLGEIAELCRKKGIFLIEDCAQSLFSEGSDNPIGKKADAVIYSFVKSLPVPDGGVLILKKNEWDAKRTFTSPHFQAILRNSLPLYKKWFMRNIKFWQRFEFTKQLLDKSWMKKAENQRAKRRPEMLKSNNLDRQKINWTMSRISKGILTVCSPNKIIEKRRQNYLYLHKTLSHIPSFNFLYDNLPDKVCPLAFPFVVDDRNRWYHALSDQGILVLGWPGYYSGFEWDDFPEACHLKDNLMTLPVHQQLDISHMQYIAGCVRRIADEYNKTV